MENRWSFQACVPLCALSAEVDIAWQVRIINFFCKKIINFCREKMREMLSTRVVLSSQVGHFVVTNCMRMHHLGWRISPSLLVLRNTFNSSVAEEHVSVCVWHARAKFYPWSLALSSRELC